MGGWRAFSRRPTPRCWALCAALPPLTRPDGQGHPRPRPPAPDLVAPAQLGPGRAYAVVAKHGADPENAGRINVPFAARKACRDVPHLPSLFAVLVLGPLPQPQAAFGGGAFNQRGFEGLRRRRRWWKRLQLRANAEKSLAGCLPSLASESPVRLRQRLPRWWRRLQFRRRRRLQALLQLPLRRAPQLVGASP